MQPPVTAARLRHATTCTLLLVAVCAQAQESDPSSVIPEGSLDEIVVVATRRASSLRDVARSVSVVTHDRIQKATQQLGLDESLSLVPGLYMQNRYNFAQDLRVSLRGFGARSSFGIRGIRVFVDGIPETLPDGQANVDSIDLGSASSIEVLRGPASSLYGNAAGGVIAVRSELGDAPPFIEGTVAGGEYGYQRYQLKAGGLAGSSDYMLSVSRQELDGYREHSNMRGTMVNGKLRAPINDLDDLTFVVNHADQPKAQDPGGINAAQVALDRRSARAQNLQFDGGEALSQQRVGVIYERNRPSGDLMLRNYYVWRDFNNRLPFTGGGQVDLDRFFWGIGAQYDVGERLPDAFELTIGFDVDRQDDTRRRYDNNDGVRGPLVFDQLERVDSNGIYALASYRFSEAWSLMAGLRYDELTFDVADRFLADGDDSGELDFSETSPSLSLNYNLASGVVFASYSSSFETPTTTELANPDASGGFNQVLEPQTADNYELGYKWANDSVFIEIAAFRIDLENELIPFELPAFPGRTFFSNAGRSERTGVETAFNWTGDNGFALDVSYTWSDFEFKDFIDDNGNDFGGNQLPGLPRQFGYLGLNYNADNGFSAVAEAVYSGDLYANNANTVNVSSYTVVNLRLSHDFRTGRWLIRPFLGVNNLFDEEYNSNIRINAFGARYFEPAPLRAFYAGVVVNYLTSESR